MRRKSSGRGRLVGIAIAGAALALAILLPGSAFASIVPGDGDNLASGSGGVALERNCNNPLSLGSQAQCSFNVAAPSGKQDVDVDARVKNEFEPYQKVRQGQLAIQAGAAVVANDSDVKDVGGNAPLILKSGEVDVHGPKIELDLSGLAQTANASATGNISQSATTGNANTRTSGNTTATGGDADAVQVPVSVIAAVGFQRADRLSLDANGGDQEGNRAGDSGDIKDIGGGGGHGGSNLAAALVGGGGDATGGAGGTADISSTTDASGTNRANRNDLDPSNLTQSNSVNSTSTDTASANGGSATGGAGGQATQTQTAGKGGDENLGPISTGPGGGANSGPAGNGGNATLTQTQQQLNGTPSSSAQGTATGGDAHAAAAGHTVVGGVSGDAYNEASIHGGTATNGVAVNATQTGDVAGRSGDVVNNGGSPSAPVTVTVNQGSQATNTQTQTPSQAANNTATNTQTASTGAQSVTPNNTVSSGQQTASGQNNKSRSEVENSYNQANNNTAGGNATNTGSSK